MSGSNDHNREALKPFLIEAEGDGFRLVVRTCRYNSQNYPIVTETRIEERFASTAAARAFASDNFAAATGEFTLPPRRAK
jgi:hypothetical protein